MKHIAIAGLGVVGGGVAEILLKNAALLEKNAGEKIVLKAIYTRTPKKDGPFAPYFVSDFSAIEQDPEIDLVVETIGGSTVALDFVSRALKAGKHVVTANKQLIAEHGLELFALAKANGVNILFEASVAGGIPVLNPLTRCLGANAFARQIFCWLPPESSLAFCRELVHLIISSLMYFWVISWIAFSSRQVIGPIFLRNLF